jgi:hypothetical protein
MMFGLLRDGASRSKLAVELRNELHGADAVVVAEKVAVVQHLGGHVPGVFGSTVARSRGAFALTATRVIATFPTGADPYLRAIDSPWDLPRGPARVVISTSGVKIDIALRGVDPAFSGSMSLNYKRAIAQESLDQLPATQLWCSVERAFVYRAAGVRLPS